MILKDWNLEKLEWKTKGPLDQNATSIPGPRDQLDPVPGQGEGGAERDQTGALATGEVVQVQCV